MEVSPLRMKFPLYTEAQYNHLGISPKIRVEGRG